MRCIKCGSVMLETTAPITETVRGVSVTVEGIEHYCCEHCRNTTMSIEAAELLAKEQMRAVARAKGILAPEEIRAIRKRLELTQREFEELIGVSSPTASRWETGAMLPSKTADTLIRLLGEFPEAVAFLQHDSTGESFTVVANKDKSRRVFYGQERSVPTGFSRGGMSA